MLVILYILIASLPVNQCFTVLESNLLAMGFAKNGEGAVAILPRPVEGPRIVNEARQAVSIVGQASTSLSMKPTVTTRLADNKAAVNDMADAASTQGTSLGGLYGLVKDHVQIMRNSSSNIFGNGGLAGKSTPSTNCVERTPTVYFCESKNTVITASSAEESFCRYSLSIFEWQCVLICNVSFCVCYVFSLL